MTSNLTSYLVIGGCGFLGHHIVSQLLETHTVRVSVLDLRTDRNRFPKVQYFDADLTSSSDVSSVLQKVKPQVIIHTASPTAITSNKPLFERVNVQGTKNLLQCAGDIGTVKAFVFTSSASVIHDSVSDLVDADESYPVLRIPVQREFYSHTKGIADDLVLTANRKNGSMLTCALRPAGIFGEGDVQMLPGLLNAYYTGKNNWQLGDNKNYFDTTYVGNVAHAHLLAAKALLQTHAMPIQPLDHERVDGEAFFITNDSPQPFWDFARMVWRAAGWKGSPRDAWIIPKGLGLVIATLIEWIFWIIFFGQRVPQFRKQAVQYSCMYRTYNINKAKKRLGYKPIMSVSEGVARGVKWYEEEQKKKSLAEKATSEKKSL